MLEEERAKRNKEGIKSDREGKEEEEVMARSLVLELESGNRDSEELCPALVGLWYCRGTVWAEKGRNSGYT